MGRVPPPVFTAQVLQTREQEGPSSVASCTFTFISLQIGHFSGIWGRISVNDALRARSVENSGDAVKGGPKGARTAPPFSGWVGHHSHHC